MTMKNKKSILLFYLFLLTIMSTGCWDNVDITERSFVFAIGLDKTMDNKIEVTFQVIRPSVIRSSENSGTVEGNTKAVWVISATGDTVFETARNAIVSTNYKMFLTHAKLIVIGENLAKEGIIDILNILEKEHESNINMDILIAKDLTAKDILNANTELTQIPGMHITESIQSSINVSEFKKSTFIELFKVLENEGHEPTIGIIYPKVLKDNLKIKDLMLQGSAVFKKDKLVGYLNPEETQGLLFATDQFENGIVNIKNPYEKNKKVSIEVNKSKSTRDFIINNNRPILTIKVDAQGNIGEQQGIKDLTKPTAISLLERELEKSITNSIYKTVDLAQNKYESDIFGFGKIIHKEDLTFWKNMIDDWNNCFSKSEIRVNVNFKITRSGYINRPTLPE
ncbi:Ger(x)C family spore germination protein [Clostridiisalibacter paucivorans]|uniref:Ger(x)C family spore germination protein n=1 Tax=Clostridiisalibacter paucivorans TaxID=408753 RepID=UPI00047B0802|nr:Ger(x)C family spore germination protein [Clostridiisalibacter paucivorans]